MSRQYRLRLRDGTVLAVDYDGLRTWLLDDKVMAQPAGARRWRPLKEILAEGRPVAFVPAPPRPAPPSETLRSDAASPAEVPASAEAPAPDEVSAPAEASASAVTSPPPMARPGEGLPMIPVESFDESLESPAAGPIAEAIDEATPPETPVPEEEISVPLKLDEDQPKLEEDDSLHGVAAAAFAEGAPRRAARPDDGLPLIPIKKLDDEEVLEELELFEEDQVAHEDKVARAARQVEALVGAVAAGVADASKRVAAASKKAAAVSGWVKRLAGGGRPAWIERLTRRARPAASPSPEPSAAPWVAAPVRTQPALKPPPSTSELPILRLAPVEKEATDVYEGESPFRAVGPWVKRGLLIAGLGAVAVAAAATRQTWMPMVRQLGQAIFARIDEHARPTTAPVPSEPKREPEFPKEVRLAANQLPHLAPETVQLVMSSEFNDADPPELFRRAHVAANRGTRALTAPEAQELAALQGAVVGALRPVERERVRAYDRLSVGRSLLQGEDAKVLALYARGVRALPRQRRERLQALYGKAIAAALAPSARLSH